MKALHSVVQKFGFLEEDEVTTVKDGKLGSRNTLCKLRGELRRGAEVALATSTSVGVVIDGRSSKASCPTIMSIRAKPISGSKLPADRGSEPQSS